MSQSGYLVVSHSRFFLCSVSPQATMNPVNRYLCSPLASLFAKRHTLKLATSCFRVTKILRMGTRPQIFNSVVRSFAIDVVQLGNKMSVVIHPHKVVHSVHFSVYNSNTVSLGFGGADLCKHGRPFHRPSAKQSSVVVDEKFTKSGLGCHDVYQSCTLSIIHDISIRPPSCQ